MTGRSLRVVAVAAVAALFVGAYPAYAWLCHPDPAGTKTLVVVGAVDGYSMVGTQVDVSYRGAGCAKRALWNVRTSRLTTILGPRAACAQPSPGTGAPTRPAATVQPDGTVVVEAADGVPLRTYDIPSPYQATHAAVAGRSVVVFVHGPARPERPYRAFVVDADSGELVRSWPLFDRPTSLDVSGGLALFRTHGTLYALRLSDGRIALVGLNRAGDNAQIEGPGVVYVDDLYKGKRSSSRTTMKFVPSRVVGRRLVDVMRPLVTHGPIRAMAMDGTRVGVAVDDPDQSCDRVFFWNVPWHFEIDVTRLLMPRRLTCPDGGGPRITQIAFGGVGLEWVAHYGRTTKLLTATLVNCDIRIVTSGDRVSGVAGDGSVLAYALEGRRGTAGPVAVVTLRHHHLDDAVVPGRTLARLAARSIAADARRVAALDANGRIELRTTRGRLRRALRVPGAAAVALRSDDLVALGHGRLRVFDAASGRAGQVWRVPSAARPEVDVHFGVAVITAGHKVIAVDLETGRRAVLARAPGAVHAQIEAPGIAYRYNARGRGFVRFVPFARIERALS
jgi:hypothetical protein